MEQRLYRYAQPLSLNGNSGTETAPLSFKEWIRINYGVIPEQAEKQYQVYLLSWYSNKTEEKATLTDKVKTDYKNLLSKFKVLFGNDPEYTRFLSVDPDKDDELAIVIPYISKKLKELAIYYIEKREEIKKTKLKYNLTGSDQGLEISIKNELLDNFTKKKINKPYPADFQYQSEIPELSTIKDTFKIEIEELYDFTDYTSEDNAKRIENISTNPLFLIFTEYVSLYYNVFSLEDAPLSAQENIFAYYGICGNGETKLNDKNIESLFQKYLGTDYYFLSGGYYKEDLVTFDYTMNEGNNFFFWPNEKNSELIDKETYETVSINDFTQFFIGKATFSTESNESDIIFVTKDGELNAAWYGLVQEGLSETMTATIKDGKRFKYPFPGYGSFKDYIWTGPEFSDYNYKTNIFFPEKNESEETETREKEEYWSTSFEATATNNLSIHDSTLIQDGAFADIKFKNADKITVDGKTAWLYDIKKTQIPLTVGENKIYFPIQRYDDISELVVSCPTGENIPLNSLEIGTVFSGSIASFDINKSDMIFELDGFGNPINAAWLYSEPLDYNQEEYCSCDYPSLSSNKKHETLNVLIVLDDSSSMGINSSDSSKTKFDFAKDTIKEMCKQTTITNARIMTFSQNGNGISISKWYNVENKETRKSFIDFIDRKKVTENEDSNYTAAVNAIMRNWSNPSLPGNKNIIVFVSDGCPFPDTTILSVDKQTEWENFIIANNISYVYGIGVRPFKHQNNEPIFENSALENLKTIAWPKTDNPYITNDDNNTIILSNENSLLPLTYKTNIINEPENKKEKTYYTGLIYTDGSKQPSLSFKTKDTVTKFIWDGNNTDISKIKAFSGFEHDKNCPYSLAKERETLVPNTFEFDKTEFKNQWKTCDCHAVYRSPLGHKGNIFSDNYGYADYIVYNENEEFDPVTWKGTDGKGIGESIDFAWFKLNEDQLDELVGWGKGTWINGEGDPFIFKKGKLYNYIRNSAKNSKAKSLPYLIIQHSYCGQDFSYWKKAIINEKGNWVDEGSLSDLELKTGYHYSYKKQNKKSFKASKLKLNNETQNNKYITVSPSDGVISYDDFIYSEPSINSLITIPITSYCPFWAVADYEESEYGYKNTKEYRTVYDYVLTSQPEFSNIVFKTNYEIYYERGNCSEDCFVWNQPIELFISDEQNQRAKWFKLEIDDCVKSEIMEFIINGTCEKCNSVYNGETVKKCNSCYDNIPLFLREYLYGDCGCEATMCDITKTLLSSTYEESDIVFNKDNPNEKIQINYYARNPFTFSMDIVRTTNGIPPNGGIWVDSLSGNYNNAKEPWKNILNSEFSVVVEQSKTDKLFSIRDIGIFVPSYLGIGRYEMHKGKILYSEESPSSDLKIYRNPEMFLDDGFYLDSTDSSWMKIQTGKASGKIKPLKNKRFDGYTSSSTDLLESDKKGKQYQTDIFGNRYILLKNDTNTIYQSLTSFGEIKVFDWKNELYNFQLFVPDLFEKLDTFGIMLSAYNDLTDDKIRKLNIFYDTVGIETENCYILYRNQEDYVNQTRSVDYPDIKIISLENSEKINHWFDIEKNELWLCKIGTEQPKIYKYEIGDGNLVSVYDNSDDWSGFNHTLFGYPQICLDYDGSLSLSFCTIINTDRCFVYSKFYENRDGYLDMMQVEAISGLDLTNKQLLTQYPMDDRKHLLVFESQTNPNKVHQMIFDSGNL